MRFVAVAETDKGITKDVNQDSVVIKHASTARGEVLMALVCDGLGGLSKGELASKTAALAFARWFDEELPYELEELDMSVIAGKWELMLKDLNIRILEYSKRTGAEMGTTFTGVFFAGDEYVVAHVGDTRLYSVSDRICQLTEDQTFIAREIKAGNMTVEQSRVDKRRNVLLQCVGASRTLEPQILRGRTTRGVYFICSDGFRHEISEEEMFETFSPINQINKKAMRGNARYLLEKVKARRERDNISVALIRVD